MGQVFSLHSDFSNSFQQLLANAEKTNDDGKSASIDFTINKQHFPVFLSSIPSKQLEIGSFKVLVKAAKCEKLGEFSLSINDIAFGKGNVEKTLNVISLDMLINNEEKTPDPETVFKNTIFSTHKIFIGDMGGFGGKGNDGKAFKNTLEDILIFVEYKIKSS